MNDDFNTPEVFAVIFDMVRQINTKFKHGGKFNPADLGMAKSYLDWMAKLGGILALFQEKPAEFLRNLDDVLLEKMKLKRADVDAIVNERQAARVAKDFARSDELRKVLTDKGISVNDLPNGVYWEVTK